MFGFLGFLLFLFLLILVIGFSIIGNVLRLFFGIGKQGSNYQNRTYTKQENETDTKNENNNHSSSQHYSHRSSSKSNRRKIFDDDEGEYVDFEDIK